MWTLLALSVSAKNYFLPPEAPLMVNTGYEVSYLIDSNPATSWYFMEKDSIYIDWADISNARRLRVEVWTGDQSSEAAFAAAPVVTQVDVWVDGVSPFDAVARQRLELVRGMGLQSFEILLPPNTPIYGMSMYVSEIEGAGVAYLSEVRVSVDTDTPPPVEQQVAKQIALQQLLLKQAMARNAWRAVVAASPFAGTKVVCSPVGEVPLSKARATLKPLQATQRALSHQKEVYYPKSALQELQGPLWVQMEAVPYLYYAPPLSLVREQEENKRGLQQETQAHAKVLWERPEVPKAVGVWGYEFMGSAMRFMHNVNHNYTIQYKDATPTAMMEEVWNALVVYDENADNTPKKLYTNLYTFPSGPGPIQTFTLLHIEEGDQGTPAVATQNDCRVTG